MSKAKYTYDDETHVIIALPKGLTFTYDDKYAVALVNMDKPADTVAYLAQRGYHENQTNIGALDAKKRAKLLEGVAESDHDATIATWLDKRRAEKAEATRKGDVSLRETGPRLVGIDKVMRDLAIRDIKKGCAKHKRPVPTGDAMDSTIAKVLAAHDTRLRAEAQAQIDAANAAADSVADLLPEAVTAA